MDVRTAVPIAVPLPPRLGRRRPIGDRRVRTEHAGGVGESDDRPLKHPGEQRILEHRLAKLTQADEEGHDGTEATIDPLRSTSKMQRMRGTGLRGLPGRSGAGVARPSKSSECCASRCG